MIDREISRNTKRISNKQCGCCMLNLTLKISFWFDVFIFVYVDEYLLFYIHFKPFLAGNILKDVNKDHS